jgi:hypothetical protein
LGFAVRRNVARERATYLGLFVCFVYFVVNPHSRALNGGV